ncbi:MAG: hypothetical protein ACE14T_03655 [Syntrophales bacterium]
MTTPDETAKKSIKINQQNLYREEVFTDLKVAAIRRLTPVKTNGDLDKNRRTVFFGQTQLMTQHGPFPIQFPIDARNLHEAIEKFPEVMEKFVEKLVEEAKEMQRQEQSRIIVPGTSISPGNIHLK